MTNCLWLLSYFGTKTLSVLSYTTTENVTVHYKIFDSVEFYVTTFLFFHYFFVSGERDSYFIIWLAIPFLDIPTFFFQTLFPISISFSHHLCLHWLRTSISIIQLTIQIKSKSSIPHMHPRSRTFYNTLLVPQDTLSWLIYFNFSLSFLNTLSTLCSDFPWRLLRAFSLTWCCCLSLQHLKYQTNM